MYYLFAVCLTMPPKKKRGPPKGQGGRPPARKRYVEDKEDGTTTAHSDSDDLLEPPTYTNKGGNKQPRETKSFLITFGKPYKYEVTQKLYVHSLKTGSWEVEQFLCANEFGLDGLNGRCRCFIQFKEKRLLGDVIGHLSERGLSRQIQTDKSGEQCLLVSVQSVRRPDRAIKDLTKEDTNPVIHGVDMDIFHVNFKVSVTANIQYKTGTSYAERQLPANQRKSMEQQSSYHDNQDLCSNLVENAVEHAPERILIGIRQFSDERRSNYKRGVYIYGPSRVGKTACALAEMNVPFYDYDLSSNFPMSGFMSQRDVLIDNFSTDDHWEMHRVMILGLADYAGAVIETKHGPSRRIILKGRVFITSQDDPPDNPQFSARFHVINCGFPSQTQEMNRQDPVHDYIEIDMSDSEESIVY